MNRFASPLADFKKKPVENKDLPLTFSQKTHEDWMFHDQNCFLFKVPSSDMNI